MPARLSLPCAELRARYESGQSTTALAEHFGCSPTTIANHLRDCGVDLRSSRFLPVEIDAETLRRLYIDEQLAIDAIARRLGVSLSTVNNKRKRYGIPLRENRGWGKLDPDMPGSKGGTGRRRRRRRPRF